MILRTKINQKNSQINPELICAFFWFIFVRIIENARSKKQNTYVTLKRNMSVCLFV